ncbi:unnamed protein product [Lactuca saligna]|uniref:MULE transposase domain-containing protein n=1 Tax=Lactuca saligna TaxID=75948 RepID=A0AA35VL51_LACSI|nr:unnamed protein product [Lactuca saligna]
MYYCEPCFSLVDGLNPISDDVEYTAFISDVYGKDDIIFVDIDHAGVGVDGWFDEDGEDNDDHESCIDGENEDNIDELSNGNVEFNEDVVIMNMTSNDPLMIGRDTNDKIYPIAWVVVCIENKQNWKWFLEHLIEDLHLNLGNRFIFVSDQHKVLSDEQYDEHWNKNKCKVKGYGKVTNDNFTVNRVAYVKGLQHNLISVSQLVVGTHNQEVFGED